MGPVLCAARTDIPSPMSPVGALSGHGVMSDLGPLCAQLYRHREAMVPECSREELGPISAVR